MVKRKNQPSRSNIKRLILFIIALVAVIVVISIPLAIFNTPEKISKRKIEALARDYYENVFYEDMLNSPNYSGDPEKALKKYVKVGISPMSVRQLVLLNQEKYAATEKYLANFCDETTTIAHFYPEPPFEKTSYRLEITYSCNF